MGTLEDGIRQLITDKYGSVPKFAEAVGLPAQTVYSALRNGITGASLKTGIPIVEALGVNPFWLVRGRLVTTDTSVGGYTDIPLFENDPPRLNFGAEEAEARYPVPTKVHVKHPDAFLVRVRDSYVNRALPMGSLALVSPQKQVDEPDKLWLVGAKGHGTTIRRVRPLANGLELHPDSTDPTLRAQVLDYNDKNSARVNIIGRVVWYCIPANWEL